MILCDVKRITQCQEYGFQSHKDNHEAVVDTKKDPVIEAPFVGWTSDLHGAIEIARDHHKVTQKKKIKTNREDHPEERADTGKQVIETIGVAAQSYVQKHQQDQVGPEAFGGGKVEIVVGQPAGMAAAGKCLLRALAE